MTCFDLGKNLVVNASTHHSWELVVDVDLVAEDDAVDNVAFVVLVEMAFVDCIGFVAFVVVAVVAVRAVIVVIASDEVVAHVVHAVIGHHEIQLDLQAVVLIKVIGHKAVIRV